MSGLLQKTVFSETVLTLFSGLRVSFIPFRNKAGSSCSAPSAEIPAAP
jgi:hypothetical protein